MSSNSDDLEQYSCDHCHQRKLKCSREKPICNQCRSGNFTCDYSRHGAIPRKSRQKNNASNNADGSVFSVEERLSAVERSLISLTDAMENLSRKLDGRTVSNGGVRRDESAVSDIQMNDQDEDLPQSDMPIESLPTSGIPLKQLSETELSSSAAHQMTELSDTFAGMVCGDEVVFEKLMENHRSRDNFFIPSYEQGAEFVNIFLERINRAGPLYVKPSPETLQQIIFNPRDIQDRGWIVYYNSIMLSHFTLREPQAKTPFKRQFWFNLGLGLDDMRVYLEPSVVKVQAFLTLASDGQEMSTPALSWAFCAQACRMIQAIGFPTPQNSREFNIGTEKPSILLFWCAYTTDRSLSLTLGRPPNLNESLAERVPFPTLEDMRQFNPHESPDDPRSSSNMTTSNTKAIPFGARFFFQGLKLGRFIGKVLDIVYSSRRQARMAPAKRTEKFAGYKAELDMWLQETMAQLSERIEAEQDPSARNEMNIGVAFWRFQYYHLIVLLARNDDSRKQECIENSRAALSLLSELVSNAANVYNGILWQLLYFPFTHFFIVFGNVLSDPRSPSCLSDLKILRDTVQFFSNMRNNHYAASKLTEIAGTFSKLAEDFVRRSIAGQGSKKRSYLATVQDSDSDLQKGRSDFLSSTPHSAESASNSKAAPLRKSTSGASNQGQRQSPVSSQSQGQQDFWESGLFSFLDSLPPGGFDSQMLSSEPPPALKNLFASNDSPSNLSSNNSSSGAPQVYGNGGSDSTFNTPPATNDGSMPNLSKTTTAASTSPAPVPSMGQTPSWHPNTHSNTAPPTQNYQPSQYPNMEVPEFGMNMEMGVENLDTEAILQSLGDKASKRPLDCSFDWMGWDGMGMDESTNMGGFGAFAGLPFSAPSGSGADAFGTGNGNTNQ